MESAIESKVVLPLPALAQLRTTVLLEKKMPALIARLEEAATVWLEEVDPTLVTMLREAKLRAQAKMSRLEMDFLAELVPEEVVG